MLPWTHLHIWPAGKAFPCCMTDVHEQVGDTQTQSLQEIWNSEKMRALRLNMLADKPSAACYRCYELESIGSSTPRLGSFKYSKNHWQKVQDTTVTGAAGNVHFAYVDIRFSNVCNLKCRSCSPEFSSSWHTDSVQLHGKAYHPQNLKVRENMISFWDELEPLLDTVEEIYFAGGEPLITEEHYKILEHLLTRSKTDVRLSYVTNFTQMNFKSRSIFDYWNKFEHVYVGASLDGNHARGEYLRKNMKWQQIVQNRRAMLEHCPLVKFELNPTVSVYNVLNLPDFHREWVEEGLITVNQILLNVLLAPASMRLQILPESLKEQVRKKYSQHLTWLGTLENSAQAREQFQIILQFLEQKDESAAIPEWRETTQRMDRIRDEDVFAVFPELSEMKASLD